MDESFVDKDYWITESLRVISRTLPKRVVFKGGTSLSKGWSLLDRFFEDTDLYGNPSVATVLSGRAIDRTLKQLHQDVEAIGGLEFVPEQSRTIGGLGRMDTFSYDSRYPSISGFPATVRLEPGVQSGDQPTVDVSISSIVAQMLHERRVASDLGVEGLEPFSMTLLHFRRTFVEKLFAIHGKIERLKADRHLLGRDARHYADLYVLASQPEVLQMLDSEGTNLSAWTTTRRAARSSPTATARHRISASPGATPSSRQPTCVPRLSLFTNGNAHAYFIARTHRLMRSWTGCRAFAGRFDWLCNVTSGRTRVFFRLAARRVSRPVENGPLCVGWVLG